MLKNTVLEIFRSFSEEEVVRFEDFLKSPFHNKSSNVVRLFLIMKLHRPEYADDSLKKEELWKKLFPGKGYNYGVMKNLIHDLKRLATKYIMIAELENNKLEEESILIRAMGIRDLQRSFVNKVNEVERKYMGRNFAVLNIAVEDYYDQMFRMKWMKHAYLRVSNSKLSTEEDFNAYCSMVICGFLSYVFMFHRNMMTQMLDKNYDYEKNAVGVFMKILDEEKMNELFEAIKSTSEKDYKTLKLFLFETMSFKPDTSPEAFYAFRDSLHEQIDQFNSHDIRSLLVSLMNSANMLNSPKINQNKVRVDCLKLMMKKNVLAHADGIIYVNDLMRFFWSAGDENEFDLIEKLMTRYIAKSSDEKKQNVLNCGRIFLDIREGKYNDALEGISKVIPESFMMKVHLRLLKARCFYALDDYESFKYERDSLNHFIKSSSSLSELHIERLKDRFSKINRLFRLRERFDDAELAELKKDIDSNENYPIWMKEEALRFN